MRRTKATLAAVTAALLASLAVFVASASATFEATMVPRRASERPAGPTFIVEAGGGRRTRIRNLDIETGACGSTFIPLINAHRAKSGFDDGNRAAVFSLSDPKLSVRIELKVSPRGEGLSGRGLFEETVGTCHERISLDLVSATIRGGGRQTG